jgi:hypothetical protein
MGLLNDTILLWGLRYRRLDDHRHSDSCCRCDADDEGAYRCCLLITIGVQ